MQREDEHPSERYLRSWIGAGLTGCSFARKFARQGGRVAFLSWVDEPSDELTKNLDPFFEQSRHERTFPFVLLPRLRDAGGIARLIALLTTSARWEVARSFADANTELPRETHDKLWETSARDSREMLRDPFDDVVWLRRVTFCLPEPVVARDLPNLMA